jgi:hypothetical protein
MEESIKENEFLQDAGEAEVTQKPAHVNKRRVSTLLKEMWPAYLIEMLVIILGISITLALEEWRDLRKENQLENIYLKNLLADVDADLHSLKDVSASTRKIVSTGNELLEYTRNMRGKEMSYPLVEDGVKAILGRPKFFSSDATFSDLKSSGNLHLLKDIPLKNMLFAYYSQTQGIKELQDAEQLATITLSGNYFLKRFPIAESGNQSVNPRPDDKVKLVTDFEFDNNVLLRVLTRKELLEVYQMADSLAGQLKIALEKKIQ